MIPDLELAFARAVIDGTWPDADGVIKVARQASGRSPEKRLDYALIALHGPLWRWRWAARMTRSARHNPWRYIDPHNQDQAWPARKAQLEELIELEPVTAAMLDSLLTEQYEEGRSDEKFGCERGERAYLIEREETQRELEEYRRDEEVH